MTSRYRKFLLVNGACVARLTCVSLCQFKELVRCMARFLTFRTLLSSLSFTNSSQCIVFLSYFCMVARTRNAIVPVRDRGTLSRLRCPGYIYFSNQRRNLVSLLRLSRLCLVNLVSSLTDFSDCAADILYTVRARIREHALARTNAT